jgi:hypothetical protein
MNKRILLVGEDPVLLATRAFLLAEWSTEIASAKDAFTVLKAKSFDLLVIGQLVPGQITKKLIAEAKTLKPSPVILAIRFPDEDIDLGVETHTTDSGASPAWFRDCVARLIASDR